MVPDRRAIVAPCPQGSAVLTWALAGTDPSPRLRAVPKALPTSDAERGKWECTSDARELGEIFDDDITCMDVVVDAAVPSQDGNTCKTEANWANDTIHPVGPEPRFFLWNRNMRSSI